MEDEVTAKKVSPALTLFKSVQDLTGDDQVTTGTESVKVVEAENGSKTKCLLCAAEVKSQF